MSELETTVTLLVDGSPESTEARRLCDAAGVLYRLEDLQKKPAHCVAAPSIHSPHFKSFEGLAAVRDYLERYHRADIVLQNTARYQ